MGGKMAMINTMALLDKKSNGMRFIEFKAVLRQSFPSPSLPPPPLILLLQVDALNTKIPAVDLGILREGGKIGQDGMNLTGVITIGTNSPIILTEAEEDPDPGTPDPTLVNVAAAMTAVQKGQV